MHQSISTKDMFSFANFFVTELNRINAINNIPKHSAIRESIITIIESRVGDEILNPDTCMMRQDKINYADLHFQNSKDEFNELNVEATRYYFVSGIEYKEGENLKPLFITFTDYSPSEVTVIVLEDEINKLVQNLAVAYDKDGNPLKIKYKELKYLKLLSEYWRQADDIFPMQNFYRDHENQIFMEVLIKYAALFKFIEYAYEGIVDLDTILVPLLLTIESINVMSIDYGRNSLKPALEEMSNEEFRAKLKTAEEIPFEKEGSLAIYRHMMNQTETRIEEKSYKRVISMAKSIKDIIEFSNNSGDSWNSNVPTLVKIATIIKNFK